MDQNVDLKVWKELAISNQILIRTVSDALELEADCSEEELKTAIEAGIRKIKEAGSMIAAAKIEKQSAIDEMKSRLTTTETALAEAEATIAELRASRETTEKLLETTRVTSAKELIKANEQLEERSRALKKINVTLADTPENVVKKLKSLNKKKFDEATARKRAEDEAKALKKTLHESQSRTEKLEATLAQSVKLAENYRELQKLSESQYQQLKELVDDEAKLTALPVVDEELLNSIAEAA